MKNDVVQLRFRLDSSIRSLMDDRPDSRKQALLLSNQIIPTSTHRGHPSTKSKAALSGLSL